MPLSFFLHPMRCHSRVVEWWIGALESCARVCGWTVVCEGYAVIAEGYEVVAGRTLCQLELQGGTTYSLTRHRAI
jgi:hypothetical protein